MNSVLGYYTYLIEKTKFRIVNETLTTTKKKIARLGINIVFVILWITFWHQISFTLEGWMLRADFNPDSLNINPFLFLIIFFISPLVIPIILSTKYI